MPSLSSSILIQQGQMCLSILLSIPFQWKAKQAKEENNVYFDAMFASEKLLCAAAFRLRFWGSVLHVR